MMIVSYCHPVGFVRVWVWILRELDAPVGDVTQLSDQASNPASLYVRGCNITPICILKASCFYFPISGSSRRANLNSLSSASS